MIINNDNRKAFIKAKSLAFQCGWYAAQSGVESSYVDAPFKVRQDFQSGFKSYKDNQYHNKELL